MSLNYRLDAYVVHAIRQMTLTPLADGRWKASMELFDLTVVGSDRADAEGRLLNRIDAYVRDMLACGRSLPVIDGVDPNPQPEVELTPAQREAVDALAEYGLQESRAGRTTSLQDLAADLGISLDVA